MECKNAVYSTTYLQIAVIGHDKPVYKTRMLFYTHNQLLSYLVQKVCCVVKSGIRQVEG